MSRTPRSGLRPRKKPLQARSRETRDAIVRAAAQVFARHGHAAGTTNRIAERAGVSIGSLYEYFPNKDAILVALVEEHLDEVEAAMAALVAAEEAGDAGDRDLAATIRTFVEAMVGMHARDPSLHRVLFEEAPLPPWLRRRLLALEEGGARAVEEILRRRGARVPDVALAARLVVQVVESLTHRLVLGSPRAAAAERSSVARPAAVARHVEEITRLVVRYLGGDRPVEPRRVAR